MERVIVRAGDAEGILDAAGAVAVDEVAPDAAIVVLAAFRAPADKPDGSAWWQRAHEMSEEIGAVVLRLAPRSLLVVIDDEQGAKHRHLVRLADYLVEEASVLSSTSVGKDLTAIGVTVSAAADREVVARRVIEFAAGPIRLGNGIVVPAADLRDRSFRDCIGEALL